MPNVIIVILYLIHKISFSHTCYYILYKQRLKVFRKFKKLFICYRNYKNYTIKQ